MYVKERDIQMPIPYHDGVRLVGDSKKLNAEIHALSVGNSTGTKFISNDAGIRLGIVNLGAVGPDEPKIPSDIEAALMTLSSPSREIDVLRGDAPPATIVYPFCGFPKGFESYYGVYLEAPKSLVKEDRIKKTVGGGIGSMDDILGYTGFGIKSQEDQYYSSVKNEIVNQCIRQYKIDNNLKMWDSGPFEVEVTIVNEPVIALRVDGGIPTKISVNNDNKTELLTDFDTKDDNTLGALLNQIRIKDETKKDSDKHAILSYNPLEYMESIEKSAKNPYIGMVEAQVLSIYRAKDPVVTQLKPTEVHVEDPERHAMKSFRGGDDVSAMTFGAPRFRGIERGMGSPTYVSGESKMQRVESKPVNVVSVFDGRKTYFAARLMLGNPADRNNDIVMTEN